MRKYIIILLCALILGNGCALVKKTKQNTENQELLEKSVKKADTTKETIESLNVHNQRQAATLAAGVQYSLNQVTNAPQPVVTALRLNERIVSIVGSAELDEVKKIQEIVDLLNSALVQERLQGQKLLDIKDKEIVELQRENLALKTQYNSQIKDLLGSAKLIAKDSDEKQTTIDSMSGFFGLSAVFWGLKKFFFSTMTFLIVGGIIFLFLRIASATNPIAGAIFSIFNVAGSFVINTIKGLAPKSFEISKMISITEHVKYKDVLVKIVDLIEELKRNSELAAKTYTLPELLDSFEKKFDQKDKEAINDILKEQKWT